MFNFFSKSNAVAEDSNPKLAGPGFIVLNILRVCNIIVLLTIAIGSWIMLVKTVQNSNFFFFDGVSHFITSSVSVFLIVSELSIFKTYFETYWPLLSESCGFISLGLSMFVLGFNILGNLNKAATSIDSLGLPLWRVVIAGGILGAVFGIFNVIADFCFKQSAAGITARQVRSRGAVASKEIPKDTGSVRTASTRRRDSFQLPSYHQQTDDRRQSRFNFKFPIRASGIRASLISKPTQNDPEQFKKWEDRSSPVVPDLQRPSTALHPAYSPSRYTASRYSREFEGEI